MVINILRKLLESSSKKNISTFQNEKNEAFNKVEYDNFNQKKVEMFCLKYDLSTVEGIRSIPISEAKKYPDGGTSVVYMPEQILSRKATEFKKTKQYDLAIACLKKANELYVPSFYSYTRDDYERLVHVMVESGLYDEAKRVHKELDNSVGKYLEMLYELMESTCTTKKEKADYKKRVIDARISEEQDREIYYFLLENYHTIAPKSFSGFRRLKNSNSENYIKLVNQLKMDGLSIESVRFWL
ncbi:MAG: hypothetical protein JJE17_00770 [Peptostreptococcaceae bacterium]|nr:hypothetical protein [Peptostreptococcaceae bacterium]